MYVYVYMCICVYMYMYIYIYIYCISCLCMNIPPGWLPGRRARRATAAAQDRKRP